MKQTKISLVLMALSQTMVRSEINILWGKPNLFGQKGTCSVQLSMLTTVMTDDFGASNDPTKCVGTEKFWSMLQI